MKAILVVSCFFFSFFQAIAQQTKVNPIIRSYGSVWEIPNAAEKADKNMEYKILVDITNQAEKPDTLNLYLEAIATLMNLHGSTGVPASNLKVVAVIHKMATFSILNQEKYRQRFKTDNPNLPLISELSNAGVQFFVCGQNLIRGKLTENDITPEVKVATSALTTLTTYQLKGYALINFK
ncbi:MAG: DsrE family protein [Chitinophagaceae bacterium]|nr:DsrE family protein [Chitinophagaceae bacterium]MEA3427279.1 DsrE family protein [Bacteroidota bacterium]MCA6452884.1 DsrE family protein [Chitinophagaceae bacterium]MCA6455452.1 DsrE family protein [Chitinophagaceae bacterium]MCA6460539.1 DsrE family protein [Chitinophagaceae bacterium]